jgi:hypothetical protein
MPVDSHKRQAAKQSDAVFMTADYAASDEARGVENHPQRNDRCEWECPAAGVSQSRRGVGVQTSPLDSRLGS